MSNINLKTAVLTIATLAIVSYFILSGYFQPSHNVVESDVIESNNKALQNENKVIKKQFIRELIEKDVEANVERSVEKKTLDDDWERFEELDEDSAVIAYEQYLEWKKTKGYFVIEDFDQYATYSYETLKQLASNGDLLAMDMLAKQYAEKGNGTSLTKTLKDTVIYGATANLGFFANGASSRAQKI